MKGFEPRFRDLPDYILRITEEIWEGRGVDRIRDYYARDVIVRSPQGTETGVEGVVAATLGTLNVFPDRELLGEDVIWCGTPETGMLSSHRILSRATHAGDGVYGPATGRRIVYRVIADCHARANRIDDEWLVRDQGAMARGLGLTPEAMALAQIAREGGPEAARRPFAPGEERPGPYVGQGTKDEWSARHAALLGAIMNADLAAIRRDSDRACQLDLPGGAVAHGWDEVERFWIGLRGALPSAALAVHHRIGMDEPGLPPRTALRWSLTGRHDGWGMFGAPSGVQVHVMGMSHAEWGPRGLRREWVVLDEVAIWKQVLIGRG